MKKCNNKAASLNFACLKGILSTLKGLLMRNTRMLIISFVSSGFLFFLCYFVDNLPYSFIGDANIGQRFEQIKQTINPTTDEIPHDLLLVNVAYDRELAKVTDEFGFPKGNIDITDRAKLLRFLTQLKNSDYQYIILDVSFSKEYQTEQDTALFNLISKMNNIVISKSANFELADSILIGKARYSDYSTHISESNFVKYEFIRNGEPTMPYQAYLDLYENSISSFAGFYFFNGKLANKSVVLRFPIKLWNKIISQSDLENLGQLQYYNLGSDILNIDVDIPLLAKNKIVVIGDFCENDIHDTYLGKIAGPIININAFYALVNDNLSIPYIEILFLLTLYFTISLFILKEIKIRKYIPLAKKVQSKTISFIFSFIGFSFVLTLIGLFCYVLFGLDINILIPSLYFSIFGIIIKYHKTISKP